VTNGKDCPSSDTLIEYQENPDNYPEIARHLGECSNCAAVSRMLERIESAGVTEEVDQYLSELDALMGELRAEPPHRWPMLVTEPRFQRTDLAKRLLTAGFDARWKDPRLAIDLTEAATKITDTLRSDAAALSEIRFEAWKNYSALLRESNRYDECRAALVRAAEAAMHVQDVEMADGAILFSRALLASEPDVWQPKEAAALLDLVEVIFARRDYKRWLAARSARATLLYRLGDPQCVQVYQQILNGTHQNDRAARMDALANVVIGRIEYGDSATDLDDELDAIEAHHRHGGQRSLIALDHWFRGKLFALRREHQGAIEILQQSIAEYRELEDYDSAVRVGIDTVASLVAVEQYAWAIELARTLAEWSIRLDQREPSRRRALTADVMSYLRELALRYSLTEDVVLDVRRYIFRITHQRPVAFVPPLPLDTV
jgi:hypothetical protein